MNCRAARFPDFDKDGQHIIVRRCRLPQSRQVARRVGGDEWSVGVLPALIDHVFTCSCVHGRARATVLRLAEDARRGPRRVWLVIGARVHARAASWDVLAAAFPRASAVTAFFRDVLLVNLEGGVGVATASLARKSTTEMRISFIVWALCICAPRRWRTRRVPVRAVSFRGGASVVHIRSGGAVKVEVAALVFSARDRVKGAERPRFTAGVAGLRVEWRGARGRQP